MRKLRLLMSSASTTVKVLGLVMLFTTAYASVNFYQKHSFQPEAPSSVMMMDDTPIVGIPCYTNGDPTLTAASDMDLFGRPFHDAAFVAVFYDPDEMGPDAGTAAGPLDASATSGTNASGVFELARDEEVGSLYGVAYNSTTNVFYSSATVRRHSGMGPSGLGAIYSIPAAVDAMGVPTGSVTTAFNLQGLANPNGGTIDIGGGTFPSNMARALGGSSTPTVDAFAYDAVGKYGIGDIDISPDNGTLYATNLFSKEFIVLDVATSTATAVVDIDASITGISTCTGDLIPCAIGVNDSNGEVFLGVICTGEGGTIGDVKGYILKYAPATTSFDVVFDFNLNYARTLFGNPAGCNPLWNAWQTTMPATGAFPGCSAQYESFPQPIVGDIEILNDGSYLVGLIDRFGYQSGSANSRPDVGAPTTDITGRPYGDVLRFPSTASGTTSFTTSYTDNTSSLESNAALGSVAYKAGEDQFLAPAIDPEGANNNGVTVMSLNNTRVDVQVLIANVNGSVNSPSAKGAGFGDLEVGTLNPSCLITASGIGTIQCTGTDQITFDLNPATSGMGNGYSVTVSSGSISPTTASYGSATTFTLGNNSAGGGDVIVTITDDDAATCQLAVPIADPGTAFCGMAACMISVDANPSACVNERS